MRRRFKSGTEYPPTIAPLDTAGIYGSEKPFELRKAKRVRFVNTETDGSPVHASLRGHETTQSPRSGAPKTSEYAYFRRVKNGAVHGNSRSLHKENKQLERSKINYLIRESISASDVPKPSAEDFRFAVSGEGQRPSDHHLFLSPRVSKYHEPEQMRSKELANRIKKRSSLLPKDITPIGKCPSSSPLGEASQNSDNQCIEKGVFSTKRHRLRQWAAHASFSEAGEPHPKRFDFVASLLSRLFPKGNENDDSSKENTANGSKSPESDNLDRGLDLSHKRDWDKNLPKICPGRSSEIVLSEWDTFLVGFPFPNCATESHPQDEPIDLGPSSKSHICGSSPTQHDFSSCLPFERYRSSGSFHLKELDEFGSVTEHPREAPNRLLLEWDFEGGKHRTDSSFINQDNADNVYPGLDSPWNVDQQRIADNIVNSGGLYSSSLSYKHYLEFDLFPNYNSASYLTQEFGPNVDYLKYAMAEPREFPLALPYTSAEDRNTGNIRCDSNIIFSYGDQHQLRNKVWDEKPQSDFWWKFFAATDDPVCNFHAWQFPTKRLHSFSEVEEDPVEPLTPFSRGTFNNHFFSSNFQSSLDTFINPPLLLNHVNHDRPDQEYFDNDNHLLYG